MDFFTFLRIAPQIEIESSLSCKWLGLLLYLPRLFPRKMGSLGEILSAACRTHVMHSWVAHAEDLERDVKVIVVIFDNMCG